MSRSAECEELARRGDGDVGLLSRIGDLDEVLGSLLSLWYFRCCCHCWLGVRMLDCFALVYLCPSWWSLVVVSCCGRVPVG